MNRLGRILFVYTINTNRMKKLFYVFTLLIAVAIFSSCATLTGGSGYWANVQVPDHPNAEIEYKGDSIGVGEATFKVKRKHANKFSVTIKEEGYETQTFDFKRRAFRGWAFAGSLALTGVNISQPIPFGIVIDAITGAWWKPSTKEDGVLKQDFDNYIYRIDYNGGK